MGVSTECNVCDGTGEVIGSDKTWPCVHCKGSGLGDGYTVVCCRFEGCDINARFRADRGVSKWLCPNHSILTCLTCNGTGKSSTPPSGMCRDCNGTGVMSGRDIPTGNCDKCKGNGKILHLTPTGATDWKDCPGCSGSGSIPIEADSFEAIRQEVDGWE